MTHSLAAGRAPHTDYGDSLEAELLDALAEATIDAILVVGADGRILYHNQRFLEMWDILPAIAASGRDEAALEAVADKLAEPQMFRARVEYLYSHPLETSRDELRLNDGRVLDRYSAPLLDDEGVPRARAWYFRDVSKVRTAQEEAELLARSGELFGASLELETALGQVAQLLVPRMADWAAVDLLDETGTFCRVGVAHVDRRQEKTLRDLDRRYPLRPGVGKFRGRVVATGKPVALFHVTDKDLKGIARDAEHSALLEQIGFKSALWVPLVARDRTLGVITVGYSRERRRYSSADLELLTELARRAALAVDNALLYRAIERAERRQAAVAALGQRALEGGLPQDLLDEAVELVSRTLDVPFAKVLEVLPDDSDRLYLVAGVGWRRGLVGRATVGTGADSQAGYTLAAEEPVIVTDLPNDPRFNGPRLLTEHGVVSGVSVIIGDRHAPYGVLGAHTPVRREFVEEDVNFMQAVANVLGAAVERQRTELRLTQLALAERARAAELKAVIEGIGDAVVVCDADGDVVLANPAAEELLGRRLRLGLGAVLGALEWSGDQAQPVRGRRLEAVELRLVDETSTGGKAPSERWLELSMYPVGAGDGAGAGQIGTILVLRDVTAARNARAVREAFLGMLSHELRTPVTTIYGGSEVLARTGATISDDERRGVYEDIRAEANRLHRLVENLLVLSRVERQGLQVDSEPVLLQRLLRRVVDDESARWPQARFDLKLPAGLAPVSGEGIYLEQVIRNLLSNAAKYGGDSDVTVRATEGDACVRVTVSDSGPGFAEDDGRRLFEIFYRAPDAARRASGAGIGLFVSQQLILAMGGRIWATNRPEGGAEFAFEMPVFEE